MLKLNASFNKKVPAEVEFSSKGYSASIEVELSDGLSQQQLKQKIHETFQLVKESVEVEINGSTNKSPVSSNTQHQASYNNYGNGEKNNYSSNKSELASSKQLKFLTDLARQNNIILDAYINNYGHSKVSELNKQECSYLINMIKHNAA